MTISVIIPVYNRAAYVREAIDSVLLQSMPAHEVIVVDDGSTDDTPDALAAYGPHIQVLRIAHGGYAAAMNAGIAAAQGALLAFCDSDDLLMPDKLARQADALRTRDDIDAVFCHMRQFICPSASPQAAARLRPDLIEAPARNPAVMLARRTAVLTAGPFDAISSGAAVHWMTRAEDRGLRGLMLSDVLYLRRIHDGNLGVQEAQTQRQVYLQAARERMLRRREPAA
jgi:glycosyltransferase involved in cell wall biosynthesis